eukprot:m51a1_g1840 putative ubiquitin carboxyl-terminal hydrolase 22-like (718) ;mRNA; f:561984-565489
MCSHLSEFETTPEGAQAIESLARFLRARSSDAHKIPAPRCVRCGEGTGRVLACLHCAHFACRAHISEHCAQTGHYLSMELGVSRVLCAKCRDYFAPAAALGADGGPPSKRRRSTPPAAQPSPPAAVSPTQGAGSSGGSGAVAVPLSPSRYVLGIRGLYNFGNTCYLNAVMQSLAHNPLLRNYFLSDAHGRRPCSRRPDPEGSSPQPPAPATAPAASSVSPPPPGSSSTASGVSPASCESAGAAAGAEMPPCLGCEMDTLVAELFDGETTPYAPHRFVYAMWKNCVPFAAAEQHDAHEALIYTLNAMHSHLNGTSKDCSCVVHRVFSGTMRSDLHCTTCGTCSSTLDPFIDVSLDIPHSPISPTMTEEDLRAYSLQGCLERFTKPELLEHADRFNCSKCQELRNCHKQLSLASLPNVVTFHLKRFDSGRQRRVMSKVETKIEFPVSLDLFPYTAANKDCCGTAVRPESAQYELFAVINHSGKMGGGHYTCFVRRDTHWYKCDDTVVSKATLSSVLSSQAKSKGIKSNKQAEMASCSGCRCGGRGEGPQLEEAGFWKVIPLRRFRHKDEVTFSGLPMAEFPRIDGVDHVLHGPNARSPGSVGAVDGWYLHKHQQDNLLVMRGTRTSILRRADRPGVVETFVVGPDFIERNGVRLLDGPCVLRWEPETYHQVHSGPEGSASLNFAVRCEGFDLKHEFDIWDVRGDGSDGVVVRQGHEDQF